MIKLHKYTAAFLLIAALALTGCGIKPKKLGAPEGADSKQFPRTYPAPDSQ